MCADAPARLRPAKDNFKGYSGKVQDRAHLVAANSVGNTGCPIPVELNPDFQARLSDSAPGLLCKTRDEFGDESQNEQPCRSPIPFWNICIFSS